MPRISVVLSSYNHERYIAQAIKSILEQTYQDYELLIFDDGSSDHSVQIIRDFLADSRIRLFAFPKNRGPMKCLREVMKEATGEYAAIMHSDDCWMPDKLDKQVAFLDGHAEYAACFSLVEFIDESGAVYELPEGHFYRRAFQQKNRSAAEWIRHFFYQYNGLCHPSVLIRREVYYRCCLLDEQGLAQLPDFFMWIRLLCSGETIYVYQEKLTKFRLRRYSSAENTSAERPESVLQAAFEFLPILQEFRKLSSPLFQAAFPEYARLVLQDDIRFALGRLCIERESEAAQIFGLGILRELICIPQVAETLQQRFQYDVRSFSRDVGQVDCFHLRAFMHIADMSVIPDYGDGYEEENRIKKRVYIHGNGDFFVVYTLSCDNRSVKRIRFDPDENVILEVKLERFAINGQNMKPENNGEAVGTFTAFYHGDPVYEVQGDFFGELEIFLSGQLRYPDSSSIAAGQYMELQRVRQEMAAKIAENKALSCMLDKKQQEMEAVLHSRSWRITAPVRYLGNKLR